jgi:hypothetical protein
MSDRLRILVSGMIAGVPFQGGAAWAVLQYVLGLQRLGHDVWLVEPVAPASLQPGGAALAASDNAAYFRDTMAALDLADRGALLLAGTEQTVGVPLDRLVDVARSADLLINIGGMLKEERLVEPIPVRVYLDLDPAFNQLWMESGGIDVGMSEHTDFVTVGLAIGGDGCAVPECGRTWITTLPPVVLDSWPVTTAPARRDAFTTVANWRSYGPIEHNGVFYGQKAHSFRALMDLPRCTGDVFALALGIHPGEVKDVAALVGNGWHLVDPRAAVGSLSGYGGFIRESTAELGVAKSGYVTSGCGWFSDRSAAYLASGRPVLAQDTGYSRFLPTGEGLLAFDDVNSAAAGVAAIRGDYQRHASAARAVAEEHLDSDKVLAHLLGRIGATS